MTCLLPTPSLWRRSAAKLLDQNRASRPCANPVRLVCQTCAPSNQPRQPVHSARPARHSRVLARSSRRPKIRRRPPRCQVPCREAATPSFGETWPRLTAALPTSSSCAHPRHSRIGAEPMKHLVPIGRTACRVIRRPSFAPSAPSALRSPAPGLAIGALDCLGSIPWPKPSRSRPTIQVLFWVPGM